ncbi:unnamed protein product [Zymoseptoria tritici ST99CH_3D1]|nr:unnamed protein product [Zymoseptoria tritici ST99CH_3D1]
MAKTALITGANGISGGTDEVSYAPLISDLTIYASTNEHCANEAFNVATGDYFCWKYMWPRLAAYFGAEASSDQGFKKPVPKEGDVQLELSLAEWAGDKREAWEALCDRQSMQAAKGTFDFGTWAFQN